MNKPNGWQKKKMMSDSRFATLYEDPEYEDWHEEDDAQPTPNLNGLLQEKLGTDPYSPYVTINS